MTPTREALVRGRGSAGGRLRYRAEPAWIAPMLATLSDAPPPAAGGWI